MFNELIDQNYSNYSNQYNSNQSFHNNNYE
jgi:hypothetical protein